MRLEEHALSLVKSFAVGNGDMFYVDHNSSNFTILDCCVDEYSSDRILGELSTRTAANHITRFISTHPDDDHIRGLVALDERLRIANFYSVQNEATKKDQTDDFGRYCQLRDHPTKAFRLTKGCQRKFMNLAGELPDGTEVRQAGIDIHWPVPESEPFQAALAAAAFGENPNNISPVIEYSCEGGVNVLWMGDLETDFMEAIEPEIQLPKVTILFAPHHGRTSGTVPASMLAKMSPKIVVIGEAPAHHLNYYSVFNTITQNSAGDIVFEVLSGKVHVFTSNRYEVDFLDYEARSMPGMHYVGTLNLS